MLHLTLHVVVPGLIATLFFRSAWRRAWLVMLLTMLVDLDHLLATPIYEGPTPRRRRVPRPVNPLHL